MGDGGWGGTGINVTKGREGGGRGMVALSGGGGRWRWFFLHARLFATGPTVHAQGPSSSTMRSSNKLMQRHWMVKEASRSWRVSSKIRGQSIQYQI